MRSMCKYGRLCYDFDMIGTYLNKPDVQSELRGLRGWGGVGDEAMNGSWGSWFQMCFMFSLKSGIRRTRTPKLRIHRLWRGQEPPPQSDFWGWACTRNGAPATMPWICPSSLQGIGSSGTSSSCQCLGEAGGLGKGSIPGVSEVGIPQELDG